MGNLQMKFENDYRNLQNELEQTKVDLAFLCHF